MNYISVNYTYSKLYFNKTIFKKINKIEIPLNLKIFLSR